MFSKLTSKNTNSNLITVFIPSFRGGGAERAMILFSNELFKRGIPVELLVLTLEGPLKPLVHPGIEITSFESKRAFRSIPQIITYLVSKRPTAIYSTIIHLNLVCLIAKILCLSKTKIIVRESNTPKSAFSHTKSGRMSLALLPLLYPLAHKVIAVSDGVKDSLVEMNKRLAKKIRILQTPAISNELYEQSKESLDFSQLDGFNPTTPFVLGAGRLHFQKDFPTLIRAFSKLTKVRKELNLIILGEGEERINLEKLVSDLGLNEKVYFAGFVKNPFPFFKKAAAFVLSSKFEGMPNVLIQAMALDVPCVSTDCKSGPREISEDGKFCPLVQVGDVESLARAIDHTITSGPIPGAANHVNEKFGISKCVDEYLALI